MIKKVYFKIWPVLIITLVIFAFFNRLFFPLSVFINPDYGRSDLLHFNIPLRQVASESIKHLSIPFWEPNIGQGFPLLDEGQIGFFYIPNLIIFGLFPFWIAFNLGYIFSFLLAAFGTYLLARSVSLGRAASYLAAITYAFSPILILRLHHYNLIQTAAIFPLLLWSVNSFFNSKKIVYLSIFSLILSQQILAGFQQITLYSLVGASLFFIYKTLANFKKNLQKFQVFSIFAVAVLFSILASSVQINSTITLIQNSSRLQSENPAKLLSDFPYNPKNLLTIFNPFILGSANNATYPRWQPGVWGIFWENNTYFGIVQVVLIATLVFFAFAKTKTKKTKQNIAFFCFLAIFGILLSLSKFGPLHPIFSIPPISFFRVPSRFLIFTFISAAILAAYSLEKASEKIKKNNLRKIMIFLIALLATTDIFRSWYSYPLITPVKKIIAAPKFSPLIDKDSRIVSLGNVIEWNNIFLAKGWVNQTNNYLFFNNLMDRNLNLIYGKKTLFAYSAMAPKRAGYIEGLFGQAITEENQTIKIIKPGQNILDFSGVSFVTSTKKLNSSNWQYLDKVENGNTSIFLYKNTDPLPRVYSVRNFTIADSIDKIAKILSDPDFDPREKVILEKSPNIHTSDVIGLNKVLITNDQANRVNISAELADNSIVVLSDSYYPGWKAKIDGRQTEILAANINSRAVVVPKGKHVIEYFYKPERFILSLLISLISTSLLIIFILKYRSSKIIFR